MGARPVARMPTDVSWPAATSSGSPYPRVHGASVRLHTPTLQRCLDLALSAVGCAGKTRGFGSRGGQAPSAEGRSKAIILNDAQARDL